MTVVEETPDRLELRQRPIETYYISICLRLLGLGFIGFGFLADRRVPGAGAWLDDGLFYVLGVGTVLLSVPVALCAVRITVTLDRTTDSVRVERAGWLAQTEQAEALSAVEDAVLEESDNDGTPVFRPVLRLVGGRTLPLTRSFDNSRVGAKRDAILAIRRFLDRGGTTYNV